MKHTLEVIMRRTMLFFLVFGISASTSPVYAQRRASELGSVSQVVNGTTIRIEYSRPGVRDRGAVFGERGASIVHWGEIWTPGANWATTFEVDRDVTLNGRPVRKGKYSLWMIPQPDTFTIRVSRVARTYHVRHPDPQEDEVTFKVAPVKGPYMENLTFYFPVVRGDAAELHFHWGTTIVPMEVKVRPAERTPIAADLRRQHLGEYVMRMTADTTKTYKVRVVEQGEFLRAYVEPMFWRGYDPYFDLNVRGKKMVPMMYKKGEMFDEEDLSFVFDLQTPHATGFTAYGPMGRAFAEATRVK